MFQEVFSKKHAARQKVHATAFTIVNEIVAITYCFYPPSQAVHS